MRNSIMNTVLTCFPDIMPYEQFNNPYRLPLIQPIEKQPIVKGARPGRNDPCICGSGQKFKKCCMNKMGGFR